MTETVEQETIERIGNRWPIKCDRCGNPDFVVFEPTPGRQIYCHRCHREICDQAKADSAKRLERLTKSAYIAPEAGKN